MQALSQSLQELRRKNPSNNQYFAPSHSVRVVMESEDVRNILIVSGVELHQIDEVVAYIQSGAWNVFAILVLIKEPKYIINFIKGDRLQRSSIDHKLPLELTKLQQLLGDRVAAQEFHDRQWGFTAPVFTSSVFPRNLPSEFVLPFVSDDYLDEGGFGKVYKIQIERSYQSFGREPYHEVVRKEFRPERKESEYEIELRNLSILRLLKHPNIIELLGSYTYNGRHNFIFPLAKGGTLRQMMREPRSYLFKADEKIIMALAGLCSAVCAVHKQFSDDHTLIGIGCHHDLKPSNIFIHEEKFLLADFGIARLKEAAERSQTSYKYAGGCYVAPECEDFHGATTADKKVFIGRSSDIWSLGCIILEVLVYMKMGPVGVAKFEEKRIFRVGPVSYHRFHQGPAEEEPAVKEHLRYLSERSRNRPESLLLELVTEILQLEPNARPDAGNVQIRIWFIVLATISEQIQNLYRQAWLESNSTHVFIEKERFDSWMRSCEIQYSTGGANSSDWHSASWSCSEFHSILNTLILIRDTLETVLPEVNKPRRLVYRPLEELNDSLCDSLPENLQLSARRSLEIQILSSGPQIPSQEMLSGSYGSELQRIGMLAVIKEMNSLVEQRSHTCRDDLMILPRRLRNEKATGAHFVGQLDLDGTNEPTTKVLYESKKYGEHQVDKMIREELHSRLEAITELLQQATATGFRVLHCQGYFHDPARLLCGLVYKLSNSSESYENLDVATLHAVLTERRTPPLLGQRFSLALALATSLLEFHKVRWLQKNISSLNIAFTFPAGSSYRNGISNPYFLGFSSSRPNEPTAFSEYLDSHDTAAMDYQHPEYLKGQGRVRYRPKFDYYSLGLVLLEIGHWRPLEKIIATRGGSPEIVRDELLKTQVPLLGQSMGAVYRDVVKSCLRNDTGGFTKNNDGDLRADMSSFSTAVVERLSTCVA